MPNLAFLGVCERVRQIGQEHPALFKHDIIGLKNVVVAHVYPCDLSGLKLAFAAYNPEDFLPTRIRGILPDGEELFFIDVKLDRKTIAVMPEESESKTDFSELSVEKQPVLILVPKDTPAWSFFTVELGSKTILKTPQEVTLYATRKGSEDVLGKIPFIYVPASPLTDDRIEAIRSNPNAPKQVRLVISCKKCTKELWTYTGLERTKEIEQEGWYWYKNLPDRFECDCGATSVDLRYARESLHAFLGNIPQNDGQLEFHRLYEQGVLESTCDAYWRLISKSPREETIQKFLENNPIVLQCFSPERIFYKAPLLTKYRTDFTILDNRGHLVLVEIERANIPLLRKDGSASAALEHAFTQVHDWLHTFEQHKQASLECIGVSPADVVKASGVVIAGRDHTKYATQHLQRLKWRDRGPITFMTYDDLGRSLVGLIRHFHEL